MILKINNLAEIFTGHTLRAKVQHDPKAGCSVIQLKDLSLIHDVRLKSHPFKISLKGIPVHQVLKKGDILLISKGSNNKAWLYEEQYAPAVAVSAFTIIRINNEQIQPEFLVWYINSLKGQEYFNTHRAGSTTLNLPKKAIEDLMVPLPTLAKQDVMMKLVKQYELYKNLVTEYENNTRLLVEQTLNNHLNETHK